MSNVVRERSHKTHKQVYEVDLYSSIFNYVHEVIERVCTSIYRENRSRVNCMQINHADPASMLRDGHLALAVGVAEVPKSCQYRYLGPACADTYQSMLTFPVVAPLVSELKAPRDRSMLSAEGQPGQVSSTVMVTLLPLPPTPSPLPVLVMKTLRPQYLGGHEEPCQVGVRAPMKSLSACTWPQDPAAPNWS